MTFDKWEKITALLESEPDKTLEEIIDELQLPIHKSRLSVFLIEAGYFFEKLDEAINLAFDSASIDYIEHWFKHCGYIAYL